MIADFHFLRPWLLLGLFFPIAVLWLSSRSGDVRSRIAAAVCESREPCRMRGSMGAHRS